MREPKIQASRIEKILPNVDRWHVQDEHIDGSESDGSAVVDYDGGIVLIDLLPAKEEELQRPGEIAAIALTAGDHPRSASRHRGMSGVDAYPPEDSLDLEEQPDLRFSGGGSPPNDLIALPEAAVP